MKSQQQSSFVSFTSDTGELVNNQGKQSFIKKPKRIRIRTREYNELQIPADWHLAEKHAMARRTAKEKEMSESEGLQDVCPCCGYEIDRQDIALCDDKMELQFLGSGFPLFYNFIIYCIYLLAVLFILEGLPNIIANYQGNNCNYTAEQVSKIEQEKKRKEKSGKHNEGEGEEHEVSPCTFNWVVVFSLANKLNDPGYLDSQIYFTIAAIVGIMVVLIIFRRQQRKIDIEVDINLQTPSDYSILIKNIPKGKNIDYEEKLKEAFLKQAEEKGEHIDIKKVVLIFDCKKIEKIEEEIEETIEQKQNYLEQVEEEHQHPEEEHLKKFDKKIEHLEEHMEHVIHELESDKLDFAGLAVMSFNMEPQKQMVIQWNHTSEFQKLKNYFRGGKSKKEDSDSIYFIDRHLYVEQSPEPNDIDWEFIHCTTKEKIKARFISNLKQLGLMLLCFSVIWAISFFQSKLVDEIYEKIEQKDKEAEGQLVYVNFMSFVISTLIVIFNKFGLAILVHRIVDAEKWSTKTKLNISYANKLSIALFVNTALITFAVEIITFGNYYGVGGMIYTEYIVFIFNAIIPPLAWIVDPWSIIKNYQRRKALEKKKNILTQKEANILMEHPDYLSGKRYADLMKTMWFTFFYTPAIPLGTFWSIIGLIVYYWADKYNIIKRRTVKECISRDLSFEMIEMLEAIIIFHAFGDFFFKRQLFGISLNVDLILLIVCFIYTMFPQQWLNEVICPLEEQDETCTYEQEVQLFDTDYDRENPVYKKEALKKWMKARQDQNIEIKKRIQTIMEEKMDQKSQSSNNDLNDKKSYLEELLQQQNKLKEEKSEGAQRPTLKWEEMSSNFHI